ncbi:MAG: lipoyl(octanoyl) transferase LipB [Deltaproteobacteria bacterium]|jgi:lipoic acid synthetase|nr:lipoyl(octanoyl) transferase LipB [Deltaproteobacteria bacterium]
MTNTILKVIDQGQGQEFLPTLELQKALVEQKIKSAETDDYLLLLEHAPAYTRGKEPVTSPEPDRLTIQNTPLYEINRGGQITFHGPGQLVLYPIFDLNRHGKDIHLFIRKLELVVINALNALGLITFRQKGATGVWVDADDGAYKKIASLGISVKHWISYNGIGLNVSTDLNYFRAINPCGMPATAMTSLEKELGKARYSSQSVLLSRNTDLVTATQVSSGEILHQPEKSLMQEVKKQILRAFEEVFNFSTILTNVQVADVLPRPLRISLTNQRISNAREFLTTKSILDELKIITACEENQCPNLGECWSNRNVSFRLLEYYQQSGSQVNLSKTKAETLLELDETEPLRIAQAVEKLALRYVVLNASPQAKMLDKEVVQFRNTAKQIKLLNPECEIEVEVDNFKAQPELLSGLLRENNINILTHNLSIIGAIHSNHSRQAAGEVATERFERSLNLLYWAKRFNKNIKTKTGILIGLGETLEEIIQILSALRCVHCDILTLGQYLQLNSSQLQLQRFVTAEEFDYLKKVALSFGFKKVIAEPLARTSYQAWQNISLQKQIEIVVGKAAAKPLSVHPQRIKKDEELNFLKIKDS